jgi:propionyl-CoA carboxylase alpha chain
VTTNRDLLTAILREPEFLAGRTDTGYLTRHDPAALSAAPGGSRGDRDSRGSGFAFALHAVVAALARQAVHRADAPVLATLPSGWRNVRSTAQRVTYRVGGDELAVTYRINANSTVEAAVNDVPLGRLLLLHAAGPDRVDLEVDGLRRVYRVHRVQAQTYVDGPNGSSTLTEVPRFGEPDKMAPSGSLLAPMPGLVLRVMAEVGATVVAGQPLIILEAMKMEQTVAAPADGTVAELHAKAGDQVSTGQVLAVVDPRAEDED